MLEPSLRARVDSMSTVSESPFDRAVVAGDPAPSAGTVLAFDFGERFVGVAVGDRMLRIAHPLATLEIRSAAERFAKIGAVIEQWQPRLLVVGLPCTDAGTSHPLAPRVQRFARQLAGRFRLSVQLVDEQFTSVEADRELRSAGVRSAKRKRQTHPQAARLILESYFNDVAA